MKWPLRLSLAVALLLARMSVPLAAAETKVDYDRDIRPVLSDNCFACHGLDAKQRKAKLRLDTREGALAELRSGEHAIVAGKPDDSVLLERVSADDPAQRMPPKKTGKHLTSAQIDLLRRWITQGRTYAAHWAFVPPSRPTLPQGDEPGLAAQSRRFLHPRPPRSGQTATDARGEPDDLDPPRDAGLDRLAANAGRGRCLPGRPVAERLREGRGSSAAVAALRRTHGPLLARRRPLRRHARPAPGQLPRNVALPRLGHPRLQRQQAV